MNPIPAKPPTSKASVPPVKPPSGSSQAAPAPIAPEPLVTRQPSEHPAQTSPKPLETRSVKLVGAEQETSNARLKQISGSKPKTEQLSSSSSSSSSSAPARASNESVESMLRSSAGLNLSTSTAESGSTTASGASSSSVLRSPETKNNLETKNSPPTNSASDADRARYEKMAAWRDALLVLPLNSPKAAELQGRLIPSLKFLIKTAVGSGHLEIDPTRPGDTVGVMALTLLTELVASDVQGARQKISKLITKEQFSAILDSGKNPSDRQGNTTYMAMVMAGMCCGYANPHKKAELLSVITAQNIHGIVTNMVMPDRVPMHVMQPALALLFVITRADKAKAIQILNAITPAGTVKLFDVAIRPGCLPEVAASIFEILVFGANHEGEARLSALWLALGAGRIKQLANIAFLGSHGVDEAASLLLKGISDGDNQRWEHVSRLQLEICAQHGPSGMPELMRAINAQRIQRGNSAKSEID